MTLSQLRARVNYWAKVLGLAHWRLGVSIVDGFPESEDSDARCTPSNQYDVADIDFKRDFLDESEYEEIEVTIVHELLHALMRDWDQSIERIDEHLANAVADLWHDSVKHEREGVVDRLSKLIVALHDE